jgi:hypothetical protein
MALTVSHRSPGPVARHRPARVPQDHRSVATAVASRRLVTSTPVPS